MLSLNDINNVGFRKSGFSGYRADDVESFVDKVKESYEELLKRNSTQEEQIEQLKAEDQQSAEKLKVLASKIEEYRGQEDEIKNALISAQKLSEASVREARHKAEIIVKDAELQAEHIISDADRKIGDKKRELENIQKQVSDFRTKLMGIYKEHLTLINALPSAPKPAGPEAEAVPTQEEPAEAVRPAEEATAASPEETDAAEPQGPSLTAQISNFED